MHFLFSLWIIIIIVRSSIPPFFGRMKNAPPEYRDRQNRKVNLEAHRLLSLDNILIKVRPHFAFRFSGFLRAKPPASIIANKSFPIYSMIKTPYWGSLFDIQCIANVQQWTELNNTHSHSEHEFGAVIFVCLHFINTTPLCAASIDDDFIMLNIDCCCVVNPNECRTYPPPPPPFNCHTST